MRLPQVLRPSDGMLSRGHESQPNTPPAGGHTRILDKLPMTASLRHTPSLSSYPVSPSSKNTFATGSSSSSTSSGSRQRRPRTAPASRSSPSSSAGRFTLKLATTMDVLPATFNVNSNNSHDYSSSSIISAEAGPSRPPRSSRRPGVNVPSSLSLSGYVADDSVLISTSTASSSLTDDSSSTQSQSRPNTPILFAPLPSKQSLSPGGDGSGAAPFSRSTTPHDPLTYIVPRRSQSVDDLTHPASPSSTLHPMSLSSLSPPNSASAPTYAPEPAKPPVRDPRKWMTVDDLIDKALFVAISETDPSYLTHFLLCYRRITTPRAVLLGMQRRLRFLDAQSSSDFLFTSFAQMRLCALLARWMQVHPHDFAVRGVHGALKAFVSATLVKPHLLHYATVFRPFIERIEAMKEFEDDDADWALKPEIGSVEEGDDESTMILDEEEETVPELQSVTPRGRREPSNSLSATVAEEYKLPSMALSRPRTASMPLVSSIASTSNAPTPTPTTPSMSSSNSGSHSNSSSSIPKLASIPPRLLQDLLSVSTRLSETPVSELADELTAMSTEHFLAVEPRDWVRAAFGLKRQQPAKKDPVARLEGFANHVADWVASVVLAHDRPRSRAKQLARFIETAVLLRQKGDYAMTRAFVAGITSAVPPGGPGRREFGRLYPGAFKSLQSLDLLLSRSRNFQAYRLALRNTEGACVPAVGVHLADLIGAGGNADFADEAPGVLAHWGKFAILGKIVDTLGACRRQTEAAREAMGDEVHVTRRNLRDLVGKVSVLTPEMQFARSSQGGFDDEVIPSGLSLGRAHSPEPSSRRSVFRQFFAR